MKTKLHSKFASRSRSALRVVGLLLWASLIFTGTLLQAAMPTNPIVEMRFSEGTNGYGGNGVTTTNSGFLEGMATFVQPDDAPWEGPKQYYIYPAFTTNVPTGTFVPANNEYAVNFGTGLGNSLGGSHGRAIDLNTTLGPLHPTLSQGTLGACPQLTVCGWLNANAIIGLTGNGGNRITHALETPGGYGFDLMQRSQGQLSLIINQYNDGSPESSSGVITADANTGSNNWVFFAVTYDPALPADHVKYYFEPLAKLGAF